MTASLPTPRLPAFETGRTAVDDHDRTRVAARADLRVGRWFAALRHAACAFARGSTVADDFAGHDLAVDADGHDVTSPRYCLEYLAKPHTFPLHEKSDA